MTFTIALAQVRVEPGCADDNLSRAEDAIAAAAAGGAALVVLPEALDCGWTHPSCAARAAAIPDGWACSRLAEAARAGGIHVCAGITERAGDVIFNSAVLLGPDGGLLLHHRKINELEIAHGCYAPGDRLGVVETALGKIGVMICADAFAPGEVVSRALGMMGAEIIVSPCAWAVPPDHDNAREPYGALWRGCYGTAARDFRMWIAGASNVGPITAGPWAGRRCIGCSLIVGPDGEPVLSGPYDEEALLFSKITTEPGRTRSDGRTPQARTDHF